MLETAIQENTAAINALIGVWSKLIVQADTITAKVATGDMTTVTAAGTATVLKKEPKVESPKPAATVGATTAPAESPSSGEVPYTEIQAAINTAVKNNREHVVATLAKFGAKKGTELKVEQYSDFLKALG